MRCQTILYSRKSAVAYITGCYIRPGRACLCIHIEQTCGGMCDCAGIELTGDFCGQAIKLLRGVFNNT